MTNNIYTLDELQHSSLWKDKSVTLVGGCFDLVHYGHYVFLQNAKKESDILVVALESDEFIQKNKKRQPVHTQKQRAEILSGFRFVDYVILLPLLKNDTEYLNLVTIVKPSVIAVTERDPYIEVKKRQAETVGASVHEVAPLLKSFSSTQILTYENILSH